MPTPSSIAPFAASANAGPPAHLGQRYRAQNFLPQEGNTVVCHLDRSDPAHRAILAARTRMQALDGAERFLFTPASSLHMTVFEGVIETRRTADAWPAGIARDARPWDVTQTLLPRLKAFTPPASFLVRAQGLRPSGLALTGATAQDCATLDAWRAALTVPFGYTQNSHDAYRFHMTFAYPLDWIPDAQLAYWETQLAAIFAQLAKAAPLIPLTPPAFCHFKDMTHFQDVLTLGR